MTKLPLLAILAISLGLTAPAVARPLTVPPDWAAPGTAQAQDGALSGSDLRSALENAGYREIRILQADGDTYAVSARKDGQAVLLHVDAQTRRFSERPAD